jgi:hypothetical protein
VKGVSDAITVLTPAFAQVTLAIDPDEYLVRPPYTCDAAVIAPSKRRIVVADQVSHKLPVRVR